MIGTVLEGRYRIGAPLARGGMSTVYRGLDLRLDRPVAIKVMTAQYAADPAFLARFEREARAAARLDDPHVVGVYDQGRDGEIVFLVMELVDGGTLRDLLRQHRQLSVPVVLSVLEPVLQALAAAHAAGLIHRDVKPENVLISARGEVKVADFGLVRAVTSTTMATGDVILGTVAYLSPEQVATGAADERSDVYSAGIVGYEMLTGHPPFGGGNAISVAYQHVHSDVPPVADAAPGVPVAIAEAIDAATSRDALARPVNAADFLHRLQSARRRLGLSPVAVPVPRPPARRAAAGGDRPAGRDGTTSTRNAATSHGQAAKRRAGDAPEHGTAAAGFGTRLTGRPGRLTAAQPAGERPDGAGNRRATDAARRARKRRRWRIRIIALSVVLVVGGAAALGGWWLGGRWTSAPSVVNAPGHAAVQAIEDAGLVAALTTRHDNTVPSGAVASADPPGGTRQLRGATVSLVISSGRPIVPRIAAGTAVEAASATVRAAELDPVVDAAAEVYDNSVAEGAVVRTEPEGGLEADVGSRVVLVVSRGPVPERVPGVAGKLPEDAQNKLMVGGFTIGPARTRFDPAATPGSVLGTDPPAGATAPHGSPVSLVLAVSLTVPDLGGVPVTQAAGELRADRFDVTVADPVFDPTVPGGHVVRTDPPAGTRIDPSAPAVRVIGSSAVTVPPLKGMTVHMARATLDDAGLVARVRSLFGGESAIVTTQDPAPGELAEPGSTVIFRAWP